MLLAWTLRRSGGGGGRLSLFWLLFAACTPTEDCNPLDFENGVDPTPETPQTLVDGPTGQAAWQVGWDNPPVSGLVELSDGVEWAYRPNGLGARYHAFDVVATTAGLDDELAPATGGLVTWPALAGTYGAGATAGAANTSFFWEAHGLRLPPAVVGVPTVVQAVRDDWNTSPTLHDNPGLFVLDPAVALVPVRVLVLYPQSGLFVAGGGPGGPDWVTEEYVDALFDDAWAANKTVNQSPGGDAFPEDAFVEWTLKGNCNTGDPEELCPRTVQPDRIFDQCGIQFRKVSFQTCAVPQEIFEEMTPFTQPSGCDADGQAGSVRQYVQTACPGFVNDGVPTAVYVGGLTALGCQHEVLGGEKNGFVFLTYSSRKYRFTLAHELGHLVGLPYQDDSCTTGEQHLMCAQEGYAATGTIKACGTANQSAFLQQGKVW